jgi:5-methylcytosine-specific restriction endonuclease McrA
MVKLRLQEVCPLHLRRDCCGRARMIRRPPRARKGIWVEVRYGLWRAADGREKCSPAELRWRKNQLIRTSPFCAACGEKFIDYGEIELAHRLSKGIGGGRHNDAMPNLALMHRDENREQGSRSLDAYLADPNRIALRRRNLSLVAAIDESRAWE